MANIYDKVPIKVQKKSGFDKSFQNLFTGKVGTIIPILTDEVIPNTTVNLRMAITTQLPPLASDTFMRVKQKYAAFFVPHRILMPGFEQWLCGNTKPAPSGTAVKIRVPMINTTTAKLGVGTLADYLGFKITQSQNTNINVGINALPFLAYHKIYDDWFRNSLVQKPLFVDDVIAGNVDYRASNSNRVVPCFHSGDAYNYRINAVPGTSAPTVDTEHSPLFADGVSILDLRQANFGIDLYTSCTPSPQNGEAQSVSFVVPAEGGESSFTISALRAANSIQVWLERNNLAGNRLVDYVKAQYGANLSDSIAQRPVLLGSGSFDVYSKGIYQTNAQMSQAETAVEINTNNPFKSVAAKYGSAFVDGNDLVIKNFTAMEPGYIMVVTWLSPKVTYSTGIDPMLLRYMSGADTQSDMANPILQNVGNEPIYASQLNSAQVNSVAVFGYNERYCNWKDKTDEVHGILRDKSTLESFALQRTFDSNVTLGADFLKIPTNYLDQVASVSGDISNYGYWCDTYFDYKVSMPLARYSIPSLQDPAYEHGEDIVIDRSGKQLS